MEATSILRDYVVQFDVSTPIPAPSTAWVQKIGVVVKRKSEDIEAGTYRITTRSQIANYTNLTTPQRILDAGSTVFYLIVVENDLSEIEKIYKPGDYYTMLFSEDFTDQQVVQYKTTTGFGFHKGLFAKTFGRDTDKKNAFLDVARVMDDFICFATDLNADQLTYNYDNIYFALGSLLSLEKLDNRQYISMPVSDNITDLGEANLLFDDRVGLVLTDKDYGNRLAGFFIGGQPIIAPYIDKLLQLDLQAAAITATNLYKPNMTPAAVTKIKDYLKQKVITKYLDPEVIPSITLDLQVNEEGWTAKGTITMSAIKALWRYIIKIVKED